MLNLKYRKISRFELVPQNHFYRVAQEIGYFRFYFMVLLQSLASSICNDFPCWVSIAQEPKLIDKLHIPLEPWPSSAIEATRQVWTKSLLIVIVNLAILA